MLPRLFEFAERDEEGVRNVVAECLGKLAAVAPDAVVPALEVSSGPACVPRYHGDCLPQCSLPTTHHPTSY